MRRAAKFFALLLLGALLFLAALVALIGRDGTLSLTLGKVEHETISFESLVPGPHPNRYLACPADYCAAKPDRVSPAFDVPAVALRDRWMEMITAQPRVTAVGADPPDLQFDFVQRSKYLSFPDTITVRFIARGEGQSSLAIYSRSHYGYDDFGVNRRRVDAWLSALKTDRGT